MWQNKFKKRGVVLPVLLFFLSFLAFFSAQAQTPVKKINLPDLTELAAALKQSVAKVEVTPRDERLPEDHPPVPQDKLKAVGSAFVVDADGYLVTNNHVVKEAKKITVILSRQKYPAKVVGQDDKVDVAVIKIEPHKKLIPLTLGNSDKLKTGSWVVAMGNPFGLENNLTLGIISGKGRQVPEAPFIDFLQTDAEIYPGNSGGPLVNLQGEAVGVNTAIDESADLSLAIPINKVKEVLPRLKGK